MSLDEKIKFLGKLRGDSVAAVGGTFSCYFILKSKFLSTFYFNAFLSSYALYFTQAVRK
jgi:hypothetical protein